MALLSQEVEIEADFDKQANAPIKPKSFTAALNVDFWECSRCYNDVICDVIDNIQMLWSQNYRLLRSNW
jgi:hypothetical protein